MVVGHADKALQLRAVSRWRVEGTDSFVCVRSMLAPRRKKKGSSRIERERKEKESQQSAALAEANLQMQQPQIAGFSACIET